MSHNEQPTNQQGGHIRLETVFPIQIREKDGALSLAKPGETVKYESDPATQNAMLATKINEVVVQLHRLQKLAFHNNKMIEHLDPESISKMGIIIEQAIANGEITHNAAKIAEGKPNGNESEKTES